MKELKEKTIAGFIWTILGAAIQYLCSTIATLVVLRFITPVNFGVIALAFVITNVFEFFRDKGVLYSIVQQRNIEERVLSCFYWIYIIINIVLFMTFFSMAPLLATLFNKEVLSILLRIFSFKFLIDSATQFHAVLLSKRMKFKRLFLVQSATSIFRNACVIVLAVCGFGMWSIVWAYMGASAIEAIMYGFLLPWKPMFTFSINTHVWHMLKTGYYFSFTRLILFIRERIVYLIIAKSLGVVSVGYFALAYEVMIYTIDNISHVINKVMFPVFSKISDAEVLKTIYLKIVYYAALINWPVCCCLLIFGEKIVLYYFGVRWSSAIMLIRILSLAGFTMAITRGIAGSIVLSRGRTDFLMAWGFITFPITVMGIFYGVAHSLIATVVVLSIIISFRNIVFTYFVLKMLRLSWYEYLYNLHMPILLNSFLMILWLAIDAVLVQNIYTFTLTLLSGFVFYVLVSFRMHKKDSVELKNSLLNLN